MAAFAAWGAETVSVSYGPLSAAIPVSEIELYAQTGKMTGELAGYRSLLSATQWENLQTALQQSVALESTLVSQLAYSPMGESLLRLLATVIQRDDGEPDVTALRTSIVRASISSRGLTVPNLLREYPGDSLVVRLDGIAQIAEQLGQRSQENQAWIAAVERQAGEQIKNQLGANHTPNFSEADFSRAGSHQWQRLTMNWQDSRRPQGANLSRQGRQVVTDLYLPRSVEATPLVVISHGVASNRRTLAYLAEHLASHGVAVALPEHSGSNGAKFQQYFAGVAADPDPQEALDRPLDVTFVLDQLALANQKEPWLPMPLLLDQTVVVGQSFGAYTALALGGAAIATPSATVCQAGTWSQLLNPSLLLQCRFSELKAPGRSLKDPRVAAVIAVNPMTSAVFGQQGLSQLDVPTMVVSGSADFVVPPVPEQLYPFTWMTVPERYLVMMRNATHFSVLLEPAPEEQLLPPGAGAIGTRLIGPRPDLAQRYLAALSLAFVQRHGRGDKDYDCYLTAAYAQSLSQPEMPLSLLVRSLTPLAAQAGEGRPVESSRKK